MKTFTASLSQGCRCSGVAPKMVACSRHVCSDVVVVAAARRGKNSIGRKAFIGATFNGLYGSIIKDIIRSRVEANNLFS